MYVAQWQIQLLKLNNMKKNTLIKPFALLVALFCAVNFGFGQTTLVKGDLAIIGVNTDNEDFTFVLRKDITTGTTIYFSDNEVNIGGTGLLDRNEGIILFTASTDYSCGTVISYVANNSDFASFFGSFVLANAGDEVLAFQGYNSLTYEWTTFLHANVDTSLANLPIGFTAADIVVGSQDNREYTGSKANPSWNDVNNIANYNQSNDFSAVSLSTTAFTCAVCPTIVTWNGTWSGVPSSSTEVIIDAPYNTGIGGSQVSFNACSLTVNSTLTVANGTFIEVENDVNVSGEIYVETQGAFVQRDDAGTFNLISPGIASVNKQTPAKAEWYYYTYWSSPVVNETVDTAFPFTDTDRRFLFNASIYLDINGDGIDDVSGWQIAAGGDILIPGVGYAVTAGPFHIPGATDSADFTGEFNTGDITASIFYNASNPQSWNLIGNPYPCGIDFNAFYEANSTIVEGVAYYWSQASAPDIANPGNEVYNFSQNDYATYSYGAAAGVMGASGVEPTPFVPSAQSFFVEGKTDGIVTFTNAMRMADGSSNNLFFKSTNTKSKTTSSANKLWIDLTSDNGVFCQTLVAYVEGATNGNDGSTYDAPKLPSNGINAILYSTINDSDKNFAIQCKADNSINEDETIQLGFKTTINVATLYTLSIAKLQGDFLTNSPIYLVDKLLNKTHDLSVCDYTFTSEVGEFNNRFEIAFTNKTLADASITTDANSVKITSLDKNSVSFKASNNLNISQVSIFDVLGRTLYTFKGKSNEETFKLSNLNQTVFIAKITLSNGAIITKKAVLK
jgi:hypothetical protein